MVKGVFRVLTVTSNAVDRLSTPSLTVAVIVEKPDLAAAGRTVTVRFAPLPPNVIAELGIKAGFDDDPDRMRFPAAVSLSLIVNARASVAVFSIVMTSGIRPIVGPLLDAAAELAVITLE